MLFPGKLYCFESSRKLLQHAVSTFQHYWKWRLGGGVTCRTEQSWESMKCRFTIYSIFLDIKNSIFYIKKSIPFLDITTSYFDLKKSISWYQKIDSWYQEIGLIFLYQEIGLMFYIIDFFFHIKKWIFLYQKSIFDITKYIMNSTTTPQCAVLLFFLYIFLILDIKTQQFDIKYQLDFLITYSIFLYDFFILKKLDRIFYIKN